VEKVSLTAEKVESMVRDFFWILPNLALGLVIFLGFLAASWAVRRTIVSVFNRRKRPDLGLLLGGFARWGLLVLGGLVVATIIFPSIRPADALGALGIGSVAIGFAFKDILQNWFAGLLILIRQPFRQGDQIVVNNFEGTVEHIEARATLIKTYDGRRVVIPNSDVYTRAVTVNTAFDKRRSEYDVGIGYGDDIEKAREAILAALGGLPHVERSPAPEVIPWELDGSSVNLRVRWWTRSVRNHVVSARGEVIEAVKRALGEAGIDLPFPTRVVLFHDQTEETDGDRRRQREGWPAGANPPSSRRDVRVREQRPERDLERA
jgi:small-conductance mechanosensitive channel